MVPLILCKLHNKFFSTTWKFSKTFQLIHSLKLDDWSLLTLVSLQSAVIKITQSCSKSAMGQGLQLWKTSVSEETPLADPSSRLGTPSPLPGLMITTAESVALCWAGSYVNESTAVWISCILTKEEFTSVQLKQSSGSITPLIILDDPFFLPGALGIMG